MDDAESSRARDLMKEPSGPCDNTRQVMRMEQGNVAGLALDDKFKLGTRAVGPSKTGST